MVTRPSRRQLRTTFFSQAARAIRPPAELSHLNGLQIENIIAVGESQSAFRMVTYINAIHPLANVFDGFLIHSRDASLRRSPSAPQAVIVAPNGVAIRDDLTVPILIFQTETDLILLDSYSARQPDQAPTYACGGGRHAHADSLHPSGSAPWTWATSTWPSSC